MDAISGQLRKQSGMDTGTYYFKVVATNSAAGLNGIANVSVFIFGVEIYRFALDF